MARRRSPRGIRRERHDLTGHFGSQLPPLTDEQYFEGLKKLGQDPAVQADIESGDLVQGPRTKETE